MTLAIAPRVAKGAAWLDENYPTWWERIDLATLNIASCSRCLLGQVYTRVIPTDEQGQILAQVIQDMHPFERATFSEMLSEAPVVLGFNILAQWHGLVSVAWQMGFSTTWASPVDENGQPMSAIRELELITDEWTRLIIERRINASLAEVSALWAVNRAEVGALVAA